MSSSDRPLSPHLQVYRLPMPALMSILFRAAGVALTIGTLVLVWGLAALAHGAASFAAFQGYLTSPLGIVMMTGWTAALYYHLVNGVRHLVWDMGRGLSLKEVYQSGWMTIILTLILTVATVWWASCVKHY